MRPAVNGTIFSVNTPFPLAPIDRAIYINDTVYGDKVMADKTNLSSAEDVRAGDRVRWYQPPLCEGTVLKNNGGMVKVQWDTGEVRRDEPGKLIRPQAQGRDAATLERVVLAIREQIYGGPRPLDVAAVARAALEAAVPHKAIEALRTVRVFVKDCLDREPDAACIGNLMAARDTIDAILWEECR